MCSKLYNINELNKDTILLKTKKLKTLCENEGKAYGILFVFLTKKIENDKKW